MCNEIPKGYCIAPEVKCAFSNWYSRTYHKIITYTFMEKYVYKYVSWLNDIFHLILL